MEQGDQRPKPETGVLWRTRGRNMLKHIEQNICIPAEELEAGAEQYKRLEELCETGRAKTTEERTERQRNRFDKRVARLFAKARSTPGPHLPIPRRRLARMLGCSSAKIQAIEERFAVKLQEHLEALECSSINNVNFNR